MNCIRRLLTGAVVLLLLCTGRSAEKKDEKKKDLPQIIAAVPFVIIAGATNSIKIRGLNLTNATELRFLEKHVPAPEIKARGKASLPDKAEPKQLGDTQLEIELVLPDDFVSSDLSFYASTPGGDSNTNRLRVIERKLLFDEKEPNAGFRKPNDVPFPVHIRGNIDSANDVDVFRFRGKAGQKIRVESHSVRYGSLLDPIVTLHDKKGHTVASSDDSSSGADALIRLALPMEGDYFLSVMDAHDRGGPIYSYLLVVSEE